MKNFSLLKYPIPLKCNALLYAMYVWLFCSCRCTSAVENKGADAGTVHGSLGCSPCASLEKELRALNSLNMNSFPGKVYVSCSDRKTGVMGRCYKV